MTEQAAGLRFDIFERIALSDDVEGIQQLEEIELTPHIQLTTDDEQAILRGSLLLTGTYAGEDLESGHRLEHAIPVEISLPMNRVTELEQIGVEIENFDVDVLSERKLSVTGVLSLRGVQTHSNHVEESMLERTTAIINPEQDDIVSESVEDERELDTAEQLTETEQFDPQFEAHTTPHSDPQADLEATVLTDRPDELTGFEHEMADQAVDIESQEETVSETIKIAFNSQESQENEADVAGQKGSIQSYLPPQDDDVVAIPDTRTPEDHFTEPLDNEADESVQEASHTESIENEWKNLLLNRDGAEEKQFSKMRLCIVQKEETLDIIAERYSLNPREIVLFNRLNEQEVAEGQIIYIPS